MSKSYCTHPWSVGLKALPSFYSYCLKAVRHADFSWNAKISPDLPKYRNPNSHTPMKEREKKLFSRVKTREDGLVSSHVTRTFLCLQPIFLTTSSTPPNAETVYLYHLHAKYSSRDRTHGLLLEYSPTPDFFSLVILCICFPLGWLLQTHPL